MRPETWNAQRFSSWQGVIVLKQDILSRTGVGKNAKRYFKRDNRIPESKRL